MNRFIPCRKTCQWVFRWYEDRHLNLPKHILWHNSLVSVAPRFPTKPKDPLAGQGQPGGLPPLPAELWWAASLGFPRSVWSFQSPVARTLALAKQRQASGTTVPYWWEDVYLPGLAEVGHRYTKYFHEQVWDLKIEPNEKVDGVHPPWKMTHLCEGGENPNKQRKAVLFAYPIQSSGQHCFTTLGMEWIT